MSGDGTYGGFGDDFAEEEAMTRNLQQEARERAANAFQPTGSISQDMKQEVRRSAYAIGYLAAATAREKEIEELRAQLEHARKDNESLRQANEIEIGEVMPLHVEIASLRAKLKAPPVDCIAAILSYADAHGIVAKDSRDYVRRWLATVPK